MRSADAPKIAEARGLRQESNTAAAALLSAESSRLYLALTHKHPVRTFGEFAPHVTSGPRSWAARYVGNGGCRFYRAQDVLLDGVIATDRKVFIEPPSTAQGAGARLQPGDLLIVITGATVGRVAFYQQGLEPGFVSQHVAICRLPIETIDGRFALAGLLNTEGQSQLLGQRYGQGKPGLNLTNIRKLRMPIPPLAEQRRIVAYLDDLQAKVDRLTALQAETTAELDALLPAILDKAFKGEL